MPKLQWYDGKVLWTAGKLATEPGCCCEPAVDCWNETTSPGFISSNFGCIKIPPGADDWTDLIPYLTGLEFDVTLPSGWLDTGPFEVNGARPCLEPTCAELGGETFTLPHVPPTGPGVMMRWGQIFDWCEGEWTGDVPWRIEIEFRIICGTISPTDLTEMRCWAEVIVAVAVLRFITWRKELPFKVWVHQIGQGSSPPLLLPYSSVYSSVETNHHGCTFLGGGPMEVRVH